jgi:hypothetical protein
MSTKLNSQLVRIADGNVFTPNQPERVMWNTDPMYTTFTVVLDPALWTIPAPLGLVARVRHRFVEHRTNQVVGVSEESFGNYAGHTNQAPVFTHWGFWPNPISAGCANGGVFLYRPSIEIYTQSNPNHPIGNTLQFAVSEEVYFDAWQFLIT